MLRFILLPLSLILFFHTTCFGLKVTFNQDAVITKSYVSLSDIATFDEDSPLSQSLASKHISIAPKAGKSATLTSKTVQDKILRELPLQTDIEWDGSATILVKREGISIGPQELERSITDFLSDQQVDFPLVDFTFVTREFPLPFVLPTGDLIVDVIPSNPDIIGSRRISLLYTVDGKLVKNISIRGKLKAMASVATLTQNVRRGSILTPGMVKLQTKDLGKLRNPCMDLREVLGKKITKTLRSGSVLELTSIDFPPLIQKGQLVKIYINHKGLRLTATGISAMSGKQDQIIRVMNTGSQKMIFCKVSAPGIVEVQI